MTSLEQRIGYEFKNRTLFEQSLVHKSFHNESAGKSVGHNERLEFLGDAVLDLSLSDLLMNHFPHLHEGELSKIRAGLVNETVLSQVATELGFSTHIKLGKGESQSGGALKPRLLSSVFEAFVGAFYMDSNFDRVHAFLKNTFKPRLENVDHTHHYQGDFKTRLQEKIQEKYKQTPTYEVLKEEGPDHEKIFHVKVRVGTSTLADGYGKSKKAAEQDAARKALEVLEK